MLEIPLLLIFLSFFVFFLGFVPLDNRPTLKLDPMAPGGTFGPQTQNAKKSFVWQLLEPLRKIALLNKPFAMTPIGQRVARDLNLSQLGITVEEYFLVKEILMVTLPLLALRFSPDKDLTIFLFLMSIAAAYSAPDFWLKGKVNNIKESLIKELPDVVDLLGLCVNAGLDFMMAIRYIVDKSARSVMIGELQNMMQEISVGKSRREALRDMARKYELPDLYTFSRTLIQADRMGTSVAEALTILSEDMREARYRRGETMALKAPLKMLLPLMFCIFPVVAILVAGPIFLDFFHNNPLQNLGK